MLQSTGRDTTITPMPQLPGSWELGQHGTGMAGVYKEALRNLPDDTEVTIRKAGGIRCGGSPVTAKKGCLRWSDAALMVISESKRTRNDDIVEMTADIIPMDAVASVTARWDGKHTTEAPGVEAAMDEQAATEAWQIGVAVLNGELCEIWQDRCGGFSIESKVLGSICITPGTLRRLIDRQQAIVAPQGNEFTSVFSGWDMSEAENSEESEFYADLFS